MSDFEGFRISISKEWSAAEFADLFSQLDFLYRVALFSGLRHDGQTSFPFGYWRTARTGDLFYRDPYVSLQSDIEAETRLLRLELDRELDHAFPPSFERSLRVQQIKFASPGHIDLLGVGKVAEELRLFIFGITDRWLGRKDRKIQEDIAREDLLSKRISNAERLLKLGDKAGLGRDSKRALVREVLSADLFLEDKVLDGKITSVSKTNKD